ncbi:MAG: hypothetical protein N4A45_02605 [Flavobacteriales bacterium]|jgi:M6 family metalloprotease-like protein|nr:hypothetical protein [Flavobacteriales bacterium]
MKQILFTLFVFLNYYSFAQRHYLPHGGVFTPKGDIHSLIIFVGFNDSYTENGIQKPYNHIHYKNWDIKNGQELPFFVDPENGNINLLNEFPEEIKFNELDNLSSYYYTMSLGKFRFTAETLRDQQTGKPIRIDIPNNRLSSINQMNHAVMDSVYRKFPNMDWSRFDKRTNFPQYLSDNSVSKPDGKPDYIIFIYRNNPATIAKTNKRMLGWGGGIATSFLHGKKIGNLQLDNAGYTCSDESSGSKRKFMSMFLHEVGHKLFKGVHYNGANGSIGKYFFAPNGAYGMMNSLNWMNMSANGYERWVTGWLDIDKNYPEKNISMEIKQKSDTFILRDFVTTGDLIRLPIPGKKNQFVWIENHLNHSPFEIGQFTEKTPNITGEKVPPLDAGCYVYVEGMSKDRHALPSYGNNHHTNAFYMLHPRGNKDYFVDEKFERSWNYYWYNPVFTFKEGKDNPLAGHNPFMRFIGDFPEKFDKNRKPNGAITFRHNSHRGKLESVPFIKEKSGDQSLYTFYTFGGRNTEGSSLGLRNSFFQDQDEISMSGIVPITSLRLPQHAKTYNFEVNGMNISFKEKTGGEMQVIVRYDDFEIRKNKRWCGSILVPKNHLNTKEPSLILKKGKKIFLEKSLTPTTYIKQNDGSFSPKTIMNITGNVVLENRAKIILRDSSQLFIDRKAQIDFGCGSKIIVEKGSKLIIEEGANLLNIKPKSIKRL